MGDWQPTVFRAHAHAHAQEQYACMRARTHANSLA